MDGVSLLDHAPAKINLTLRVLGRRSDGYHVLESLVVFADVHDTLRLIPGRPLGLSVTGIDADACGPVNDNLVLRGVRALVKAAPDVAVGHFDLQKSLPIAGGVGGGSADAAAALRLVEKLNPSRCGRAMLETAARTTGADVSVCLEGRPRMMRGAGEILGAQLALPPLAAVLVNPRVAVPTKDVFAALGVTHVARETDGAEPQGLDDPHALLDFLAANPNDLERPALQVAPSIGDVLAALARQEGCQMARMSGSGATCFGLFVGPGHAHAAAERLAAATPGWWVKPVTFNANRRRLV